MNPASSFEARPLQFGGAVRLVWIVPTDANYDRVIILRKSTDTFTGHNDPNAVVVLDGVGRQATEYRSVFLPSDVANSDRYRTFLDDTIAAWNQTVYYAIYISNANKTDVSSALVQSVAMPHVSVFEEIDLIGTLIPFLHAYMKEQITRGYLVLKPGITEIPVVDGPPFIDDHKFPIIALHLNEDRASNFAVGDNVGHMDDEGDNMVARRGYISMVTLSISGVTDSPEIRRSLYRVMKGAMTAVRELLEKHGVLNMELSGRYSEDFEGYDMPLFSAEFTLNGAIGTSVFVPVTQLIGDVDVHVPVLTPVNIVL